MLKTGVLLKIIVETDTFSWFFDEEKVQNIIYW